MATDVNISNMALSMVGAASVATMTDSSASGVQIDLHYTQTRDECLSRFPWNFAETQATLSETSPEETHSGWTYCYDWPSDCLRPLRVYNSASYDKLRFQVKANIAKDDKVIVSDTEDAVLIYTYQCTDPTLFEPLFVKLFSLALALKLVVPLNASIRKEQAIVAKYLSALNEAESHNAGVGTDDLYTDDTFITART